ncbi:hypothetical protein B9Z19DRAFT_1135184 [Tuber borchii]|uniref:Uncharacterized protein n=1 Tax=Tuber borchii TaxID=42251 RepID=A0A2T6ZD32_TUBBO|nr:hypothetical protein B9Z19DRAFT_1135184 [Tuber borchii]
MDGRVVYTLTFGTNATIPVSDEDPVRCGNNKAMDVLSLEPGTHRFAVEWVWALKTSGGSDQKDVRPCSSLILAGWGRGEANVVDKATSFTKTSTTIQSNTTIIYSQQISPGESKVIVDGVGTLIRSKIIVEPKYDDPTIFSRSTTVGNFTAQLAMLPRAPQQALSKFYKCFFAIVLALNPGMIFVPEGNVIRFGVGQLESWNPRMFMDPVMFYITCSVPRRWNGKYELFYAQQAFEEIGGDVGYGRFKGPYKERHVGIERMISLERAVSVTGDAVVPVLVVDHIGT